MGPERFPVFALRGGSIVMPRVGLKQDHIARAGENIAIGVTETSMAAQIVNQHPIPASVGAVGIETRALSVNPGDQVARWR